MRMFRFDSSTGQDMVEFGSHDVRLNRIFRRVTVSGVAVMHVAPGGVIGRHPAAQNQLFLVADGSGWVSGEDGERREIRAGQAAFWLAGENHELGSDEGMMAIALEGPGIDPEGVMPPLAETL